MATSTFTQLLSFGAMLLPQYFICTRTFRREMAASVDKLRGDKECLFSGVTSSGRVWKRVAESDARSVASAQTPSSTSGTSHGPIYTSPWNQYSHQSSGAV